MSRWMEEINAQFLTQVGLTVDRLNGASTNATSECSSSFRSVAGSEIQEIVRAVISDIEAICRDYVYLLQDSIDLYVSFNQVWHVTILLTNNVITDITMIVDLMDSIVFEFYKEMFEVQVEEILIEIDYFNNLINETKTRAFTELSNVNEQMERNLIDC